MRRLPPTTEEHGRPASSAELGKSYRVHPTPPLAEARVRTTAGTRGEGVTLESSPGGFSTDGTILKLDSHVIKQHMKTTHKCMEKMRGISVTLWPVPASNPWPGSSKIQLYVMLSVGGGD